MLGLRGMDFVRRGPAAAANAVVSCRGAVRGDTCAAAGAFALCLYASGTWVSQCIYRGVADAPKLGNMKYAVGVLYVLSVLLGPVLLLRLGLEQWRKRREKTAAPWEKTGEP